MTAPVQPIEVLLVEDDIGDELIPRKPSTSSAGGGRSQAPWSDLILLDLNLPKRDGCQALERIKSDEHLVHVPVVVLTTSSKEEDILHSDKLHANACVTMPFDLVQYIAALRQIDEFFVTVVRLPRQSHSQG